MNKLFTTLFALLVSSVTAASLAQDIKGDAKAGMGKNAMCIGCHGIKGYQASFPEVYKVPMISGQSAAYIASALRHYQKGERMHPTMRAVSQSLTEQDIADLAAFYSGHGVVAGAEVQALLNKANCASCHGANFSKPIDPAYPKIAGQHADYLFVALKAYKTDNNAKVGRPHPIMGGMARQYTNAELKSMSKYLASLPGELKAIPESRFR